MRLAVPLTNGSNVDKGRLKSSLQALWMYSVAEDRI